MVRADRQLALERSQRLGHMTGASWFFVALARHAREHGGGELLKWDGEGEASDYLYARRRRRWPGSPHGSMPATVRSQRRNALPALVPSPIFLVPGR
jgi:hypothetical protein